MSYQQLEKTFYRLAQIGHASSMLAWDQQVFMPAKSNAARGRAMAELSALTTEILQHPGLEENFIVAENNQQALESWQRINLREMRNVWQRAMAIPKELVHAEVLATNECEHAWRAMRPDNNWNDFEPLLEEVFRLAKAKAQALNAALGSARGYQNDYDALLDIYDPGSLTGRIEPLFAELKQTLPDLVQQITSQQQAAAPPLQPSRPISKAQQIALARELMELLGFDFDAGRLDEAAHPFSGGVSEDSRVTARYNEYNVIEGMMAIIHETGHSRYETGLHQDWRYQPVGKAMGMGMHESQSLLFETQLGRSKPFIDAIAPLVVKHCGSDAAFNPGNLLTLLTRSEPGLIRVNADEVTYPLHIILRYELERDIVLGRTRVSDVPDRWDEAMHFYLGLKSKGNFKDGPMQDIHWPAGAIGYFPSYTLGAMNAAQLWAALIRDLPKALEQIASLDLQPVFTWLAKNIWQRGRLLSYDELMIQATGESLNSQYFLKHLDTRYLQ